MAHHHRRCLAEQWRQHGKALVGIAVGQRHVNSHTLTSGYCDALHRGSHGLVAVGKHAKPHALRGGHAFHHRCHLSRGGGYAIVVGNGCQCLGGHGHGGYGRTIILVEIEQRSLSLLCGRNRSLGGGFLHRAAKTLYERAEFQTAVDIQQHINIHLAPPQRVNRNVGRKRNVGLYRDQLF